MIEPDVRNSFEELQEIDLLLYQKRYLEAYRVFARMLEYLATIYLQQDQLRDFHHGDSLDEGADICQRASFQWQRLLQSNLVMSTLDLGPILRNMHILHALMMGSYRSNMDDFVVAYHLKCNGQYDKEKLLHQLLAWCPNSNTGFTPFSHYRHAPDLVIAHAVACIMGLVVVSDAARSAQQQALDFLLSDVAKPEHLSQHRSANLLATAWMRCSYLEDSRKHQIKPFLTQALEWAFKLPRSFLLPNQTKMIGGKPVLFVPLEGMTRNHAMYRCYSELILACREKFHTVGLGVDARCDDAVAALFDHFELVENSSDANSLGKAVEKVQAIVTRFVPAVVWFPSIGMDRWVMLLANRRMAPLQVMTLGHPATSMSKQIDAILMSEDVVGDVTCFNERVVRLRKGTDRFVLPEQEMFIAPLRELPDDGVVRIVVPSIAQKLTASFINCLREVQERAQKQVEFVFFTGERGVSHAAATHNLMRELKHLTVHSFLPYADYIREINRCQIHACTFPFGGTNSLVDSLRQGLPLVALEGREAHSMIDVAFIRGAGLPESCIAKTQEEYVNALLDLVNNPDKLLSLHRYLLNDVDLDAKLFAEGHPEWFADTLYQLHLECSDKPQQAVSAK